MTPFYERAGVAVYQGDCREILPELGMVADVIIADPPYAETSLGWDRWPDRWVDVCAAHLSKSGSLWCFGSFRMFWTYSDEFMELDVAQDVVWEKQNGSSLHNDRFRRVHEHAVQFIRGDTRWVNVFKNPVTTPTATARKIGRRQRRPAHFNDVNPVSYESAAGGPLLMRSVIHEQSCHGYAENETQKPIGVVSPLVSYSCPPGGLVISPFAGSGTDGLAALRLGMRAILIETREEQCVVAARRLSQELLPGIAALNVLTPNPSVADSSRNRP